MKRCNKKTKAYKMGHSAGLLSKPHNTFAVQSTRWVDYEQGYQDGHDAKPQHDYECYQCEKPTDWLAPDSRCGECTRWTPEEIRGEVVHADD